MSFHVWTKQKLATIAVASVTALTVGASLASVAGATVPHAKLPLITSFKASPNSLPDKGGTVKVTADVKFAKTCTLSVSPAIKGLPEKNFSCTAASITKSFAIATDTSASPRTYTFHLSAKNTEGTVSAPTALVSEGGAPPPISFGIGGENFGTVGVSIHSTDVEVQVTNNSKLPQSLGEFGMVGTDASDFGIPSNDCRRRKATRHPGFPPRPSPGARGPSGRDVPSAPVCRLRPRCRLASRGQRTLPTS